jgi:hypothetical protein
VQLGRRRDAELLEQRVDVGAHLGRLADARLVAIVLDDLDLLQARDDVAPCVPCADLGDPLLRRAWEPQRSNSRPNAAGDIVWYASHSSASMAMAMPGNVARTSLAM